MAEVVQVCFRSGTEPQIDRNSIQSLSTQLLPDNITADPPITIRDDQYLIGVLNPRGIQRVDNSVGAGAVADETWSETGSGTPDGSYAVFRNDKQYTELVSDIVGSRTIWYGFTNDLFVASTLQRAVVTFLQNYTPNPEAQAWMLSAGMLGPYCSWAKEVDQLPPNSVLRLDRESWKVGVNTKPINFKTVSRSTVDHYQSLVRAIEDTFSKWPVSPDTEVLTLSGGYDSRALLHHLSNEYPDIRSVTWGTQESIETELSDADIAQRLAHAYNTEHQFKSIQTADIPVEAVIDRFIQAGEGRIDHLSGYLDGFDLWADLHSQGVKRVIRGDEGFGWIPPVTRFTTETHVRRGVGLTKITDIPDLQGFGLPEQQLPGQLSKESGEHLGDWRDRLYQHMRIPTVIAALNGLKSPYVEVSNPLLSKDIISTVRQLPVELRDDKSLFTQYVDSISSDVPYATSSSNPPLSRFLSSPETATYLRSELDRVSDSTELPSVLIENVRENVESTKSASRTDTNLSIDFTSVLRRYTPRTVIDVMKRLSDNNVVPNYNQLAFRIIIIARMDEILSDDADRGY